MYWTTSKAILYLQHTDAFQMAIHMCTTLINQIKNVATLYSKSRYQAKNIAQYVMRRRRNNCLAHLIPDAEYDRLPAKQSNISITTPYARPPPIMWQTSWTWNRTRLAFFMLVSFTLHSFVHHHGVFSLSHVGLFRDACRVPTPTRQAIGIPRQWTGTRGLITPDRAKLRTFSNSNDHNFLLSSHSF